MRKGFLYVVSGPSGVGKSSVVDQVKFDLKRTHPISETVSCTTRARRESEEHGIHYHFIDVEEFHEKINSNEFLEYAEVFGNYYGTLRSEVLNRINTGEDVVSVLDVEGALNLKNELHDRAKLIFLIPPSPAALNERLSKRGENDDNDLLIRQREVIEELKKAPMYDYVVVNSHFYECVDSVKDIIRANLSLSDNLRDETVNILEELMKSY